jgi:hypothetical protein
MVCLGPKLPERGRPTQTALSAGTGNRSHRSQVKLKYAGIFSLGSTRMEYLTVHRFTGLTTLSTGPFIQKLKTKNN